MDYFIGDDTTLFQNLNITAPQLSFKEQEQEQEQEQEHEQEGAVTSPAACHVVKVLLHQGMKVVQGQPLFVMNVTKPKTPFPPSQQKKILTIKNFLNHSGVGIYSMRDVLVELHDPKHDPMAGFEDTSFENFKRFDTVFDHSDHLFSTPSCWPMKQPPHDDWTIYSKIHEEWSILKEHLPETVFVRAYEDRKDLLRAVIIGPKGTPYHDGLFFFDLCFPSNYPHSPPRVCSLSFYLGLYPNLNDCDEVRLIRMYTTAILENTWVPGTSNMLNYLVSIQALVFNTKNLFNVLSMMGDTVAVGSPSLLYNENILIKSLRTMVCTMTKPPKHFETFVAGHFRNRARDILMACNSYKEGMQVGFLVSSNIHSCSTKFKRDSASCMKLLEKSFNKIGAKEVEGFLHQIETRTPPPASAATPVVDADLYAAFVRKRKVVSDEGFKKKRIKSGDHCFSWTVRAPFSFTVAKVLVEEGSQVEKGQPLYIMESRELEIWNQTTQIESTVKKMMERSHFGICSMENVLMGQNHSRQMEGHGNEDVPKMYENLNKFDTAESFCSDPAIGRVGGKARC